MKKTILGILMILVGSSHATSLKQNVRLQSVVTPLINYHHLPAGEVSAQVITVDSLGYVTGAKCTQKIDSRLGVGRPYFVDCTNVKEIDRLSRFELRKMDQLIKEATLGEIVYPKPGAIHCLAMPIESYKYTANNGLVLLQAGSRPCGNVTRNTSDASQSLVKTLVEFEGKYHQLLSK